MIENNPKISINPLVEYIHASERRRHTIIKQQKNPSDFIIARYRTARAAISSYFTSDFNKEVLLKAINRLQSKAQTSDWSKNDTANSIEALRRFLAIEFPFKSLKCHFAKPSIKSYTIRGVDIIISPDLILEWEVNNKKYFGSIKFYIKKKNLTLQEGRISSSILAYFAKKISSKDVFVSNKHCICIDVMNSRIFSAPENIVDDITLVSDACEEIRTTWLSA